MSSSRRQSFYHNLNLKRCMLVASPFWLAAVASQDLGAVTYNATDMATLRTAINSANAGSTNDIINIAAGTYTLTGAALDNANASGDLDITKATGDLQIVGAGTGTTIIDGATLDRVFHINAGAAGTITIQNLTIQNGRATDDGTTPGEGRGGGVLLQQGNLTLSSVVLTGNAAVGVNGGNGAPGAPGGGAGGTGGAASAGAPARGGGIYANGGTLNVSGSTLSNNSATGGDGGVGGAGGQGVSNFSATGGDGGSGGSGGQAEGGALYIGSGALNLTASTISGGGVTGGDGGAGGVGGNAGGVASLTTFLVCFGGVGGPGGVGGSGYGGGLFVGAGTINVTNSTISGVNAVGGSGGDGGAGGNASGISSASVVYNLGGDGGNGGNSGICQGAGIYGGGGTLAISNSTVASGTATAGAAGAGGAAGQGNYSNGSTGSAGTSTPSAGGGLFISGSAVTVDSTIFSDSTADTGADVEGNLTAGASLFESAPNGTVTPGTGTNITGTDPGLAALANNGGPTQTRAISSGSAAENAGSNPLALSNDQRGSGFNRVSGGTADIGAFEIQSGGAGQTANPAVTAPGAPITINAATFNVQGTAPADSLVRIYSDLDNNGAINGADAVVGQQQLTGGATSFSISVTLTQDAPNNFTATADDPTNTESNPVDVPTITEDSTAPSGLVVTDPATALNTVGTTYNIQGTAEADSLVQIYRDVNNNGVIDVGDTVAASGTATGGNFNIATPLTQGAANDFLATAEDAAGNESGPTDVPTITETTALTTPPLITTPSGAVTVDQANFSIEGTAVADSLVRIYSDANNNGLIDGADAVVGQQQLTGGATSFAISVLLTQNAANNFTATADDATNAESTAVNVPTITDNNGGGNGKGKGKGSSDGSCAVDSSSSSGWLALGAMLAAMVATMCQAFRRRQT